MNKFIISLLSFLLLTTVAQAQANKGIKFQAKIKYTLSGALMNQVGASVNVRVLSPNGCVLWEENHPSENIVNGYLGLVIGSGNTQGAHPVGTTFKAVFDNSVNRSGLVCVDSGNNPTTLTTYLPTPNDTRIVRIYFASGADNILADFSLRSSGYAVNSETLDGKSVSDFVLKSATAWPASCAAGEFVSSVSATGAVTCTPASGGGAVSSVAGRTGAVTLSTSDISGLGTAALLGVGTSAGTVAAGNDVRFTKINGVAVSATAPATNQVLQYDGTQYVPVALPNAPVTTVAGRTGAITLTNVDISGLGGAALLNVGTAASTVAAGNDSRIVGAFQASSALAGDLSGTLTTASVAKIRGVPVSATAPAVNQVLQYDGTQYVPIALPTAPVTTVAGRTGAVILTNADISGLGGAAVLNIGTIAGTAAAGDDSRFTKINGVAVSATAPATNQVLQFNGTQYVPVALPTAPVTTVAGRTGAVVLTNADISGLGGAALLNVGTAASTVAAGNDSRITGALQSSTFNAYVASASCTASQSMYWNSVSSTFLCQSITVASTTNFSGSLVGDVTGTQGATSVTKIRGVAVSATAPATNQVLQFNGTQYVPVALPTAPVTTVAGRTGAVVLTNADISGLGGAALLNVGTALGSVAAGDDSRITGAFQSSTVLAGDLSGTLATASVAKIRGVAVSATAPVLNQVLQYNGTQYVPVALPTAPVTTVAGRTGAITLSNADISGLGGAALLNVGTALGSVAAGDDSRIIGALQNSAFNGYVASASCTASQSMYWNSVSSTFLCQAITVASATNFSGSLVGDVTGTQGATSVTKIRGVAVSATAPALNQVLQYDGTQYVPVAIPSAPVSTVAGRTGAVVLSNTDISGLGGAAVLNVGTGVSTVAAGNDSRITGAFQASTTLAGDLSGTLATASVAKIRGVAVSATAPVLNQVLQYDGTQYVPVALPTAPVTTVAGRTGAVVLSNADISGLGGAAVLNVGTAAGTVAAGDDSRFTKINGVAVSATAPATNQVLQYDGTQYVPVALPTAPVTTVAGRTGAITLSNTDISGLGGAALLNVGTAVSTVAAGNDSRIVGALQSSAFNAYVASANCTSSQSMYWNSVSSTFLCQAITLASATNFSGSLVGDVTGTQGATSVAKIRGVAVSATAPVLNQVLQYDGTQYVPAALPTAPVTTVAGRTGAITLSNADISGLGGAALLNVGTALGSVAAGDDSRFTKINGVAVSATAPALNQVLQYNGTQYVPAALPTAPVTTVAGRTGAIVLTNSDISGLGGAAILNVGTAVSTVAAGNDSRIIGALQNSAFNAYVAAANCTASQSMYWNSVSSTFLCQAITVASATNFSGSLVGDVTGTQGATSVTKIRGVAVSATAPALNQVLQYDGTQYVPAALPTAPVTTVAGRTGAVVLSNTDITGLGGAALLNVGTAISTVAAGNDSRIVGAFQASTALAGDLSGTLAAASVAKIRGVAVSATAPVLNQVLQYDGTQYVPAALPAAPVTTVAGRTGAVVLSNGDISGLGGAAILNVGTAISTVAAGNDSRIVGALQSSAFNAYVASASCTSSQSMYWNSVLSQFLCQAITVASATNFSGSLVGDVTGTQGATSVTKIRGVAVSATAPVLNQVLQYDGTQYVPAALPAAPVTTVAGRTGAITLSNLDISGLGGAAILNVGTVAGTVAAGNDSRFLPAAVNPGDVLYYNGTAWMSDPFTTRKMSRKITDFSGNALPTGLAATAVSGACSSNAVTYAGYFGALRCSTGTTATGWTSVNNGTSELKTGKAIFHKQTVVIPALSSAAQRFIVRVGLSSNGTVGSADPATGVYLRYSDAVNTGKFECVSRNASVESVADSGVTVTANIPYELEMRINAAVNQVTCFVNGVAAGTVITNIPAASGSMGVFTNIQKTVGTATLNIDILDWETVIVK